jgi:hypothetical protein
MSKLIIPEQYKDSIPEFELPFSQDAHNVVDSNGRIVATVNATGDNKEAIRIAKLFASGLSSIAVLLEVAEVLEKASEDDESSLHGKDEEDQSNCLICQIRSYVNGIIGAPKNDK